MSDGDAAETADTPGTAADRATGGSELPELDPVIHAQARLRVISALSALNDGDRITFPGLQAILRMTAGNLSVHLRKLETARYVEITKTHHGRTPTTYVALTRRGRLAFEDYTAAIRTLLTPSPDHEES